ncbi:MAG TPA: peptidase domain-containing ABC transporter [Chitinophaga sp.]
MQKDQADCGVVCLQNILNWHGIPAQLESLRSQSGTDEQGTTLLGLHQCAQQLGFDASGAVAEGAHNLAEVEAPCILHLTLDNRLLHYVIYYPSLSDRDSFTIGDPARGIVKMGIEELNSIWVSKACLLLSPTELLKKEEQVTDSKWSWFWKVLQPDVHLLYLAFLLGIVVAILNLSTAVFSQQLIDKILPGRQTQKLVAGSILLVFLLLMRSGISYLRSFLLARQLTSFNTRMTGSFFSTLLQLPKSFFDNRKTGDLIARLNDLTRIQQALNYMLAEVGTQILLLLTSIVFIFVYNWMIGLGCLVIIPAIFMIVRRFEDDIIQGQKAVMATHAVNESNYVDSIKGIGTIKAMGKQPFFSNIAVGLFGIFQQKVFDLARTKIRFTLWLDITAALFLIGIISWSSVLVFQKDMLTGQLVAILQMAGLLLQTTITVALTNVNFQEAKIAFERMYEFTSIPGEEQTPEAASLSWQLEKLHINGLDFGFPGRAPILQGITLEVRRGEIIAVTGETGQGKSTLFQVLQRFYARSAGAILINDAISFDQVPLSLWRHLYGVVPQETVIFSGSLAYNILLNDQPEELPRLTAFCKEYGFDAYFGNFYDGYATILGEGGVNLSGGQKQLVSLARCLYQCPQLLLLDEPTAAMDHQTERFVITLLERLKPQTTTLIISHKDNLINIADRTYEVRMGRLRDIPTPTAIVN